MDIRQLQYLAALAREKHFTRAAIACNVTQPTLSGRIRQLELELEVPIVERGQRYRGLTPEGERVLKWAQVILKSWQAMQEELGHLKDHETGLKGRVVLGGIPSALPMIPLLTKKIRTLHPGIDFTVLSHSSEEIIRGLADFSIDVGITYLDNEPIEGPASLPALHRTLLPVRAGDPRARRSRGRHLARGVTRAALPIDAEHAESAHHRPRVRDRELPSDPAAGNKFRHQFVLECEIDGPCQHHAAVHIGGVGERFGDQGHPSR